MTIKHIASSPEGRAGIARVRAMLAGRDDAATPLAERRAALAAFAAVAPPVAGVTAERVTLGGCEALQMEPDGATGAALFLHGGAYVLGSAETHRGLAARYATAGGFTAWALDYPLAPEHPYPAALEAAVAAFRALAGERGAVALVGDSAGGGLALATAQALRDRGGPVPAALALASPWLDLTLSGESMTDCAGVELMLSAASLRADADRYRGGRDPTDPAISPLFGPMAGLPPTLIQVGTAELLRDDAVRLYEVMTSAGVPATLEVWDDMGHAWAAFGDAVPEAAASIARLGHYIGAALNRAV